VLADGARAEVDFAHPVVQTFTVADVGVNTRGWSMAVLGPGKVAFGLDFDLAIYDGERWQTLKAGKTTALIALAPVSDGRIWVGGATDFGWLAPVDGGFHFHSLRDQVAADDRPEDVMHSVFPTGKNSAIWVGEHCVRWWNDGRLTSVTLPAGRGLVGLRYRGDVYVWYPPSGLFRSVDNHLVLVLRVPDGLKNYFTYGMYDSPTGDGSTLLATGQGFFRWKGAQLEQIFPAASEALRGRHPIVALALPNQRVALGTTDGGVVIVNLRDGTVERIIDRRSGLPSDRVWSLGLDAEGGLWINSTASLSRVTLDGTVQHFLVAAGNQDNRVDHLAVAKNGAVMVATDDALYARDSTGEGFRPVASPTVRSLAVTGNEFWIGRSRGIDRRVGNVVQPVWFTNGDPIVMVPSLAQPGHMFVGAENKAHDLDFNGPVKERMLPQGANGPDSFAEGADGRIWATNAADGLYPLDRSGAPVVPTTFTSGIVVTVSSFRGNVFAFSDHGAIWLRAGTTAFTPLPDVPARPIGDVELGDDGSVWALYPAHEGLGSCIGLVLMENGSARWVPVSIDGLEQLGPVCSFAVRALPDHWYDFWIGGLRGVLHVIVDPARPVERPPLPEVSLRRSSPDSRSASLTFAVPTIVRRAALRLESHVDGLDSAWEPVGPTEIRTLFGLHDGSYEVQARVVDEFGSTGPVARVEFDVPPPWWRTKAARAAELLLAGTLLYGAYRLRVRRLRAKNLELEGIVRQRTEQATQAREQAETANAAKSEFIARVSHNIRNPLHGLSGLALALENTPLDSRQKEYLTAMKSCATSLSLLLDDVLDFAQIEAGRIELRPEPFAPIEVLQNIADSLQTEARNRGAWFELSVDPQLIGRMIADRGRVQEIVMNFATNALKYAGGGRIVLGAGLTAEDPGRIEFFVADQGPGLKPDESERLFTLFARGRGAADHEPGNGLGLAICRRLAGLMEGTVGVDSAPGTGARFHFRLPLVTAAAAPAKEPMRLYFKRVLLVEDVAYNVWATTAILGRLGIEVAATARTAAEAIQHFATDGFDLVLLDRRLPDGDGLDVARQLRALEPVDRHALVIAVTAFSTAEDRQACLEAGMDGFVGKPLTPEKLERALARLGDERPPGPPIVAAAIKPGFDTGLLQYLSAPTGRAGAEQLDRFVTAVAEETAIFKSHLEAQDWGAVRGSAHRLLGLAEIVQAAELITAARLYQEASKNEGCDKIPPLAEAVATAARSLIEALSRAEVSPRIG
jgi:signal transduction histidine kinase/CheY-like chemotaxis protein